MDENIIRGSISKLPHYSHDVTIHFEQVGLDLLKPLCLFVRTYRLTEVRDLVQTFKDKGITLFNGVWLKSDTGDKRLLPPPVIEVHNNNHVIIDGLHRVYEARCKNIPSLYIAVIRGNLPPLPADILEWSDVQETDKKMSRQEKFRNLNEANFREINKYIDDYN